MTNTQDDIWLVKKLTANPCFLNLNSKKNSNFLDKYLKNKASKEKELVVGIYQEKEVCSNQKVNSIFDIAESWRIKYEAAKKVFQKKLEEKDSQGIKGLILQQKSQANKLWKALINIEHQHGQCIEQILKKCNQRLSKHSTESPCKIQYFIEFEILRYNQMTLHNQRILGQLYRDIQLQIANWWLQYSYMTPNIDSILSIEGNNLEQSSLEDQEQQDDFALKEFINLMIEILKRLNHFYRDLIEKLFYSNDQDYTLEIIQQEELVTLKTSLENLYNVLDYMEIKKINIWRDMIDELINHYQFIQDSWEVLHKNQTRINQIYYEILKLIKEIEDHYSDMKINAENNLSQALDNMRRESTINRLNASWGKISTLLNRVAEIDKEHFLNERNSTKIFIETLLEKSKEVVWAELAQLIYKYIGDKKEPDLTIASNLDILESKTCFIEDSFLKDNTEKAPSLEVVDEEGLRIHLNSLRNWQLGLNEALKMYGLTLKKRIEKLNEQWNQEFKDYSGENYQLHSKMIEPRQLRIREEVYDTRLAELRIHIHRFERHESAVMQILDRISNAYEDLVENEKACIWELEEPLKQIENAAFKEENILKIRIGLKRLDDLLECQKESLLCAIESLRSESNASLEWIQRSGSAFIKALQLFSEGGNYSSEEATNLSIKIDRLSDKVYERSRLFNTKIDEFQANCLEKIENLVNSSRTRILFIIEDFKLFNNLTMFRNKAENNLNHLIQNISAYIEDIANRISEVNNTNFEEILNKSQEIFNLIKKDGEASKRVLQVVTNEEEISIKHINEFYGQRGTNSVQRSDILPNSKNECISKTKNEYQMIKNKNEDLLNILLIDFNERMQELYEKGEKNLMTCINELHLHRLERLNKRHDKWEEMILVEMPKISAPLLSLFGFPGNQSQLVHQQEIAKDYIKQVEEFLRNAVNNHKSLMDEEAKIYAQEHPSVVQAIKTTLNEISKLNSCEVYRSCNIEEESNKKLKEYTKIYLQKLERGGEKILEIRKNLQSWIDTWSIDVKNIKKLYTIKYE